MSDHTGPYDPNALEGEKAGGTQYISMREIRIGAVALAILSVPMYFIYGVLQGNSERHRCISNLRAIYAAVNLYAEQHDNRFPPIARTEGDGVTPSLDETGRPYTWVSDTAPFMSPRQSFQCPTATEAERVRNESPESTSKSVLSSYGMYAPYGGVLTSLVEAPDQIVLVAETSDRASKETFDPAPFGTRVPDGFTIGWNDGNALPTDATKSVSRLAFPGAGKGDTKQGRHGAFLQGLSASGELISLTPGDASYHAGGGVNPHWRLPPGFRGMGR